MHPHLERLRAEVRAGRLSRHGLLEEMELHLERSPEEVLDGALELILEEVHHHPSDPHARRLLARLYERDGDREGAKRALSHLVRDEDLQESLEARLAVARVLLEVGQIAEAEALTRNILAAEPNGLSALNLLAKICHVRGRLTEALRLWHTIRQLAPSREGALAQLGLLHRFAQDADLVRLRLAAVGEDLYARKHPAQSELEEAYTRFRARDFKGAIAACDGLARDNRSSAPSLYKLAVLQKAWFQERTDDLQGARATLELLGRERGFETDLDRLAFLARICERLGTPDALGQAMHIYEHLNVHHGKLSALPRLSALYRAAGDGNMASRYQREFERRFARRMHKPSPSDTLRALSLQYFPPEALGPIQVGQDEREALEQEIRLVPSVAGRRRCRAVLALLSHDATRAAHLFKRLTRSRSGTPRDWGYLGDALRMQSDEASGHAAYVEAVRRAGPAMPGLWERALAGVARGQDASGLAALASDSSLAKGVREMLLSKARVTHTQPEAWDALATFERCAGMERDADLHRTKAEALRSAARDARNVGWVHVAAVCCTLDGKTKGLVHELSATRRKSPPGFGGHLAEEGGVLGNVTTDFRALVPSVLVSAKDFVRAHWPHLGADADDFVYTLKVTKDDEPSGGSSAGLPLAIAFISLLIEREVPSALSYSGAVVCDARGEVSVRPIGDALYKLKGAYHRNLSGIVLPSENRAEVESGDVVPLPVARAMVRYADDLSQAVELTWGAGVWDL